MPSCCCLPFRCCCQSKQNETDAKSPKDKSDKIEDLERALRRVQRYGTGSAQVIIGGVLIATILWLLVRVPEPQVYVTHFEVEAISPNYSKNSEQINYNISIHNPDLFKSLHYDVLILRINPSNYSEFGYTIDSIHDPIYGLEKGISQRPGETTFLPNNTLTADWGYPYLASLKYPELGNSISLNFVMQLRVRAFNKVITTRQLMKTGVIYFYAYNVTDDKGNYVGGPYGKAFIPSHGGLRLT